MMKAIIFDFDGTLADTLWIYIESYKKALAFFGLGFSDEQVVAKCFGRTEEAICEALSIADVERFRDEYFGSLRELVTEVRLFDGAEEFLRHARQKDIRLSLASFAQRWYIDLMVSHLRVADYFNPILSFNDVAKPKPNPEILYKAAGIMGVDINGCLVIGDSKGDIAMGKEAGGITAIFTPELNRRYYDFDILRQSKPDYEVSGYPELEELVEKISSPVLPSNGSVLN